MRDRKRMMTGAAVRMAAAICAAAAVGCGGCGRREETEYIALREQSEPDESAGDFTGQAPGESAGDFADQMQGRENGSAVSDAAGTDTARAMVMPPERCQAEFATDYFSVSAGASVTMPETGIVGETGAIRQSFSEETFRRVSEVLSEAFGLKWQEQTQEIAGGASPLRMADSEGNYLLDYLALSETENDGSGVPLIWCVNIGDNRELGDTESVTKFDVSDQAVADKREIAEAMDTKTAALLADMGLTDYHQRKAWWSHQTYSGQKDGIYFYHSLYTPEWSDIPFASERSRFGNVNASGPYLQVIYREDGTLEQFKLIDHLEEQPSAAAAQGFLLPFQSIGELFERYIRDNETAVMEQLREEEETLFILTPETDMEPNGKKYGLAVTRIDLEYAWTGEPMWTGGENGADGQTVYRLAPVWSFYGRIDSGAEELLLSIRADDGQALVQ